MLTASPRPRRRWSLVPASLAVVLALASACSDDEGGDGSESPSGAATGAPSLTTTTKVTRLTGRLTPKRRKAVSRQVTAVVDGWWDAAYLSPDKGDDPFPGFTPGAADLARRDRDIMTIAALPGDAEEPVAVHRSVGLDVLAVRGRPAGVTAHVWLAVKAAPGAERVVAVRGLLELSRQEGKWQVFGYSMTAGPPPAPHGKKKAATEKGHHHEAGHHEEGTS